MALNRTITGTIAAILAGTCAVAASAQERTAPPTAEQLAMQQRVQMWNVNEYIRLQGAVEANSLCRGKLSEPAMRAAVNAIEQQTGEPLSPGKKLTILDQAKWDMKAYIIDNGCATPRVQEALTTFDTKVLPGIHGQTMD
jgi:hypothetical protein